MERLALVNNVKAEKHLEIYGELREDVGMKPYLHGPMYYAKTAETAISCWGAGPTRKKKDNIPVVGRRTWLQICARVAQQ